MSWLDGLKAAFGGKGKGGGDHSAAFVPITANTPDDEKRERVDLLSPAEFGVYKWLRENYTLKWTAETLFIPLAETRIHEQGVYRKLGVKDQRGLIRLYGFLDKEQPEVVVPSTFVGG